jgi:hypothetical protein
MLAGAGMGAVISFHSACRFFSQHVWDTDRLGLTLARLVVERLLPPGEPILIVVDDALFRRWAGGCTTRSGPRTGRPRADQDLPVRRPDARRRFSTHARLF